MDNVIGGDLKTNLLRLFKVTAEFEHSFCNGKLNDMPYTQSGNAVFCDVFPSFLPKLFSLELKYIMIDAGYKAPASGVVDTSHAAVDPADPTKVVIIHRFPSIEAAQGFLANPALKEAMINGGVTAPPSVIMAIAS